MGFLGKLLEGRSFLLSISLLPYSCLICDMMAGVTLTMLGQ